MNKKDRQKIVQRIIELEMSEERGREVEEEIYQLVSGFGLEDLLSLDEEIQKYFDKAEKI